MTRLYFGASGLRDHALGALLEKRAALLLSFALEHDDPRIWDSPTRGPVMLDSGAFTAWNSGGTIDRDALHAEYLRGRYAEGPALDDLEDADRSRANWLWSAEHGSDQWPTFHYGEPFELLDEYAAKSWKIGLGGIANPAVRPNRGRWLSDVFKRAWPHRFHAFGLFDRKLLVQFPFHSVDSAIWMLQIVARTSIMLSTGKLTNAPRSAVTKQVREKSLAYMIDRMLTLQTDLELRWSRALREAETHAPTRPALHHTSA